MTALLWQFLLSLRRSFQDLLPIILVIGFFQFVVLRQPVPQLGQILAGGLMVLVGLSLFVQGLIIGGYLGVVVMTAFAPPEIIGIAYDSGGVTTSTVTVPLVAALGIGLASSIRGRDPLIDGFGLIAFASLTPMIFVMGCGMLF